MIVLFIRLQYSKQLQDDLPLRKWTKLWQLKINTDRCAVLRCTRSLISIQYVYTISGHNIDIKKLHIYIPWSIDNNMSWLSHIQTISNRSTKVLNFIKQNLTMDCI